MIHADIINRLYDVSRKLCDEAGELELNDMPRAADRYYAASDTLELAIDTLEDLRYVDGALALD